MSGSPGRTTPPTVCTASAFTYPSTGALITVRVSSSRKARRFSSSTATCLATSASCDSTSLRYSSRRCAARKRASSA